MSLIYYILFNINDEKGKEDLDIDKTSEKKNIFYTSFKNIQERFSYKEQRVKM